MGEKIRFDFQSKKLPHTTTWNHYRVTLRQFEFFPVKYLIKK